MSFVTSFGSHCPQADTFHCFAKYVSDTAGRDRNSLDLVLGPEVFITDAYLDEHDAYYTAVEGDEYTRDDPPFSGRGRYLTRGVPWTVKFVSLEAKNRFVEFCQALSAALRLTYADRDLNPDDDGEDGEEYDR